MFTLAVQTHTGAASMPKPLIQIPAELIESLKDQLELTFGDAKRLQKPKHLILGLSDEFTRVFKRPPNDDDPIYYDPNHPTPVARSLEDMLAQVLGVATDPNLLKHIETIAKETPESGETMQ
jgi:hypothetical protein